MNNEPQFTLPPMVDGQDSWDLCVTAGFDNPHSHRPQSLWDKIAYGALMWLHDRTERIWSWSYHKARPHAADYVPPQPPALVTVRRVNSSLVFIGGEPLTGILPPHSKRFE